MSEYDDPNLIEEVAVSGTNRAPGVVKRAQRAPGHFAAGTVLPRLQGILNPSLYRERGDTSRLVDSVLGEDGALARLAQTNPDLATEIRQQSESPMTVGEHKKFRSALLNMVGDEVGREQKVKYQLQDNQSFFQAFKALDGFLPGAGDDKVDTREEYERRAVESLYQQAQEIALIDPDRSASIMGEVRKKADALTDNVRTDMEKQRRTARAEDGALWASARERITETSDVIRSLESDLDEKGLLRKSNPALVGRAMALLGRAGDIPAAGIAEASDSVGSAVAGSVENATAGNVLGEAIKIGGAALDKYKETKDVRYLIDRLKFNGQLVEESYTQDRAALADRYKAVGLQFGEKPGEIYSVPNEAYKREAEKIKAAPKKPTDDTDSLRGMLTDEVSSAQAAVDKVKPEASANVPGAAARLASAMERLTIARDDSMIFEDDQRQAGGGAAPVPVVAGDDAAQELIKARQRRAARDQQRSSGLVRKASMEALRGYTR